MGLNVEHLLRTADTLEQALLALQGCADSSSVLYDLYRNAAIKSLDPAARLCARCAQPGHPTATGLRCRSVTLPA